jgi:hypothetical protein
MNERILHTVNSSSSDGENHFFCVPSSIYQVIVAPSNSSTEQKRGVTVAEQDNYDVPIKHMKLQQYIPLLLPIITYWLPRIIQVELLSHIPSSPVLLLLSANSLQTTNDDCLTIPGLFDDLMLSLPFPDCLTT